ncbi:MAG: helix-turn-helix domain-containing protein [Coriobacteriia bacterium]|nr:helix-turn-helix domain-containing protein [Coriobacteriia bacterium]
MSKVIIGGKASNVGGMLSVVEAAEALHCTTEYVRICCRRGELDAVKFGRKWLIPVHAVEAIIYGGLEG